MSIVKCYYCEEKFDNEKEDYVKPNTNRYAHKECYKREYVEDEFWIEEIYSYFNSINFNYNYQLVETQRKNFINKKCTNKGIYLSLRYFYDVKKGDKTRANGGIGIVPYVYEEAKKYFFIQEKKRKDFEKMIDDQVEKKIKTILVKNRPERNKERKQINLEELL